MPNLHPITMHYTFSEGKGAIVKGIGLQVARHWRLALTNVLSLPKRRRLRRSRRGFATARHLVGSLAPASEVPMGGNGMVGRFPSAEETSPREI